jgi:hypothetical protein
LGILGRCRYGMEEVIRIVTAYDPAFSIFTTPIEQVGDYKSQLSDDQLSLLKANIEDRDILIEGKALLMQSADHAASAEFDSHFGGLLYKHYKNLRDHKRTSTFKIERMMNAALGAGALGGKINGCSPTPPPALKKWPKPLNLKVVKVISLQWTQAPGSRADCPIRMPALSILHQHSFRLH